MKNYKFLTLSLSTLFLVACSSTPTSSDIVNEQIKANEIQRNYHNDLIEKSNESLKKAISDIPDWYLNPINSDPNNFYGVGVGGAVNLNIAVNKSQLISNYDLAKKVNAVLSGEETMSTNVNDEESHRSVIDLFVNSVDISQVRNIKKKVVINNGKYFVYTLTMMPKSALLKGTNSKSLRERDIDTSYKRLLKRVKDTNNNSVNVQVNSNNTFNNQAGVRPSINSQIDVNNPVNN